MVDGVFARMPFSCFRYPGFSMPSKRYHTAAKQATSFFDSSFNYIRQNSQIQTAETLAQGAKRYPHPHPANAAAINYIQFDHPAQLLVQDEENNNGIQVKNTLNFSFPFTNDHVLFSIANHNYQQVLKTFASAASIAPSKPFTQTTKRITSKLQAQSIEKKQQLHTSTTQVPAQEPTPASSPVLESKETEQEVKYFTPGEIEDVELTDATFLELQTNEIIKAYKTQEFEKINSLYMALKRNGLVPSREIYSLVLSSIAKRTIDDSLDEKVSTMLNVYQDLIANKIKPDLAIYSTVIYELLNGAIQAMLVPGTSNSGMDFFKIAIDIFNASNCTHIQNFDSKITDLVLIGMNLYPGLVNHASFMKILEQQTNFVKNEIYYSSLINYSKFINDSELAISLYEEFKVHAESNAQLKKNQFVIYASFISTLVATDEIALATKFLDKLLTSIKSHSEYETKITMILSAYLLSLSKVNYSKSLEIWAQFNRINWIPEFSYEFYSHLLEDSLHFAPYDNSLKLYNYMTALPRSTTDDFNLNTLLVTPRKTNALSHFLLAAIANQDKSTVLKMLKESFVRKSTFDYNVYPSLLQFLSNDELIVRVVNTHGLMLEDGFEFLTFLTSNVPNLPVYDIAKTEFFKKLIAQFSLEQPTKNWFGFLQVWVSVFNVNEMSAEMLELCSPLIVEFHDLNNYYLESPTQEVQDFKLALTHYYTKLCQNMETGELGETTQQAIALLKDMKLMT